VYSSLYPEMVSEEPKYYFRFWFWYYLSLNLEPKIDHFATFVGGKGYRYSKGLRFEAALMLHPPKLKGRVYCFSTQIVIMNK